MDDKEYNSTLVTSQTQRHPSRPPLARGFPVLSMEKLKQLQKDLGYASTVSLIPNKSSRTSRKD